MTIDAMTQSSGGTMGMDRCDADSTNQCSGLEEVIQRIEGTIREVESACARDRHDARPAFDLTVIVPVFNERQTIPDILRRIAEVFPDATQTVVVDDASSDGTAAWLASLPTQSNRTILLRGRNHGKGSAVRLGIRHSRGQIVAIQDADTEYDPIDLLRVIEPIQRGEADVVYGSRYLRGSEDPSMLHRLGNRALTAISNCMTGQQLTDMETCHKAFRGQLIRSIPIQECRFGFEPEVTGKIALRGVRISEVPTGYKYRSYDEGKKITWKDGVAAFVCIWRYRTPGWFFRAAGGAGRLLLRLPSLGQKLASILLR
jgi:glycosyltransferase involved in cell wall biosynthesis